MALVKQTKQSKGVIDQRENLFDGEYYSKAVTPINSFVPISFDSIERTSPSATEDQFDYYQGGIGGTLVATLLVTYVDASKDELVSVERTFLLEA